MQQSNYKNQKEGKALSFTAWGTKRPKFPVAILSQGHGSGLYCSIAPFLECVNGIEAKGRRHVTQADIATHNTLELRAEASCNGSSNTREQPSSTAGKTAKGTYEMLWKN